MQTGNLTAHRGTELGVEVGQRFVQQEDGRVTDHGAAQCNTLALAAGKRLGLALQQMLQVKNLRCFVDALVDFIFGNIAQCQTEGDVLIHGHMRIQSIVLEDHGDVAIFRRNIVDEAVSDIELTAGDALETGDHTQGGGLAAPGRPDQDDEFLVRNFKVQVGDDGFVSTVIDFGNVSEADGCHEQFLLLWLFLNHLAESSAHFDCF